MEAPGQISLTSLALQQILPLLLKAEAPDPAALKAMKALVGQELALLLLSAEPGQIRLQTPGGRVLTAQGELPFPPGSELKVRVLADPITGGIRLQTLEAKPPAVPTLLSPLTQGEASSLLAQLERLDPPAGLKPLVELNQVLKAPDAALSTGTEVAVRSLPMPLTQAFAKVLGIPLNSPPTEVVAALSRWTRSLPPQDPVAAEQSFESLVARDPALPKEIKEPMLKAFLQIRLPEAAGPTQGPPLGAREPGSVRPSPAPPAPEDGNELQRAAPETELGKGLPSMLTGPAPAPGSPVTAPLTSLSLAGLSEPATRLLAQALGLPDSTPKAEAGRALDAWVKDLLSRPQPDLQRAFRTLVARAPEGKSELRSSLIIWGERNLPAPTVGIGPESARVLESALGRSLEAQAQPSPSAPESWEAWLRTSTHALSDPGAVPSSAPFHAAQGKEGTALFEIPLPWAPQSPLQLWVESDSEGEGRRGQEAEKRVLMGLHFTQLGDTRIGLAQSTAGLKVRVWAEHPERLQAQLPALEAELKALGRPVDLRVLTLDSGSPNLRQVAATRGLEALG